MKSFLVNNLLVKLAETEEEYKSLFKLRYLDLLKSYNTNLNSEIEEDKDEYDKYCDHIIVVDLNTKEVVGTYRLIKSEHLKVLKCFLTETEFDISPLKNYQILEVGRAVVKEEYRVSNIISLLWKAIINYAIEENVDYMIGTASFHGIDPSPYLDTFAYLYDKHLSSIDERCNVNQDSFYPLNIKESYDLTTAKNNMPPLVKGYLNLGATIGDGVYIDRDFNSLDILIVLKIKNINERYLKRFLK